MVKQRKISIEGQCFSVMAERDDGTLLIKAIGFGRTKLFLFDRETKQVTNLDGWTSN